MNDLTTISPLPVAVPPMLEAALGYTGDAHLVAFYCGANDHAYSADGQLMPPCEWDAYDLFVNHPLIAPHLAPFHLGSADEPPSHYLLLDRERRMLAVIPVADALRLLRDQWASDEQNEPAVTEEELDQLRDELLIWLSQVPCTRVVLEQVQAHQHQVEALAAWLAEQWEEAR